MKQDSTFKRSGTSPAGSAPSELRGFAALAGSHPSTENDKSRFWRWVATMMYGLWRVAGREQKGACGIPPARWVWSEDLELFYKDVARSRGCLVLRELEWQVCWRLTSRALWAALWRKEKSPLRPDKLLLRSLHVASGGTLEEISGSDRRKNITSFLLQSKEIVDLLFKHTPKPPWPSSHPCHPPSPAKRVK